MKHYFSIQDMIKAAPDVTAYTCIGAGGVGKSYSVKQFLLERAILNGEKFIYTGRVADDTKSSIVRAFFEDITIDGGLAKIFKQCTHAKTHPTEAVGIDVKNGIIFLVSYLPDGKMVYLQDIGKTAMISNAERFKRGTYSDYLYILFDEFVTNRRYYRGNDEPVEFEKIVQTVARSNKKPIKVFLLGNPDNEIDMCPYVLRYNIQYDKMNPWEVYIIENTAFIKITADGGFLDEGTHNLYTTGHNSRFTGEVDRPPAQLINLSVFSSTLPVAEIVIELPTIANISRGNIHHRKIYVYVGIYKNTPVALFYGNRRTYATEILHLYSRWDKSEPTNLLSVFDDVGTQLRFISQTGKNIANLLQDIVASGHDYYETEVVANVYRQL